VFRKWLVLVAVAILAALVIPAVVQTDTSTPQITATVSMGGQASVIAGGGTHQLRLKISAQKGTPWLVESSLNAVYTQPGQNSYYLIVNLSGTFTLGVPGNPVSKGTASGWLSQDNTGDLQLKDANGITQLDVSFTVTESGTVTAKVQGIWPVQSSSTITNNSQPALSAPVNHSYWYLSRAAAIVAYLLFFVNLFLGLGLRAHPVQKMIGKFQVLDLHKFTALLGFGFVALHVFSLLGDRYFNYTLPQLFLPGNSPYRQVWITVGIIAFYGLLIIILSHYVRKFIWKRAWRFIHYLSFLIFVAVLLHSILSGTDLSALWGKWLYVTTGTATVFLFLWRFVDLGEQTKHAEPQPVKIGE
jgi:branched-subunit amino acid transport protein